MDLRDISAGTWLTDHFIRRELMDHNAQRGFFGLFSPAALSVIEVMRETAGRPLHINSGYRSPGYNSQLDGAARWSRHTYGDAIDFRIDGRDLTYAAQLCEQVGAAFVQVYQAHVHCDWRTLPLEEAFYGSTTPVERQKSIVAVRNAVQATGEIHWEDRGTLVSFSANIYQEDAGELTYQWIVRTPSGRILQSESSSIEATKEPGTYEVEVLLGGTIPLQDWIHVPTSSP